MVLGGGDVIEVLRYIYFSLDIGLPQQGLAKKPTPEIFSIPDEISAETKRGAQGGLGKKFPATQYYFTQISTRSQGAQGPFSFYCYCSNFCLRHSVPCEKECVIHLVTAFKFEVRLCAKLRFEALLLIALSVDRF